MGMYYIQGLGAFGAALFGAVILAPVLLGYIGGVKVKIKELELGSEG